MIGRRTRRIKTNRARLDASHSAGGSQGPSTSTLTLTHPVTTQQSLQYSHYSTHQVTSTLDQERGDRPFRLQLPTFVAQPNCPPTRDTIFCDLFLFVQVFFFFVIFGWVRFALPESHGHFRRVDLNSTARQKQKTTVIRQREKEK